MKMLIDMIKYILSVFAMLLGMMNTLYLTETVTVLGFMMGLAIAGILITAIKRIMLKNNGD